MDLVYTHAGVSKLAYAKDLKCGFYRLKNKRKNIGDELFAHKLNKRRSKC